MSPKCKLVVYHPVHGYAMQPQQDLKTIKRNQRERSRVQAVNKAYDTLSKVIPSTVGNRKMSKVNIIHHALDYINNLINVLEDGPISQNPPNSETLRISQCSTESDSSDTSPVTSLASKYSSYRSQAPSSSTSESSASSYRFPQTSLTSEFVASSYRFPQTLTSEISASSYRSPPSLSPISPAPSTDSGLGGDFSHLAPNNDLLAPNDDLTHAMPASDMMIGLCHDKFNHALWAFLRTSAQEELFEELANVDTSEEDVLDAIVDWQTL